MPSRFRFAVAALLLPVLAGCDFGGTQPISISLEFIPNHTLNVDGTCSIQFAARAQGIGTAQWTRVEIRRNNGVVASYEGQQTREYWTQSTISAGEQLLSVPFRAPDAGANVMVIIRYRITGPERETQLQPSCTAT